MVPPSVDWMSTEKSVQKYILKQQSYLNRTVSQSTEHNHKKIPEKASRQRNLQFLMHMNY